MATTQVAESTRRQLAGRVLVTLGLATLLADLAFLAVPLRGLIERLREGLFGLVPALGLSFLNAARAIAFHQVDYFSLISRILVLFSAMVAIIFGVVKLNSRSARAATTPPLPAPLSAHEETVNGSSR